MRTAVGVTVALLALAVAPAAHAVSVSIDVGRIEIEQDLTPGGSYRLPDVGVTNPGKESASYVMVVSPLTNEKAPPGDWFEFSPERMTLASGKTRKVTIRLELPRGADPGDYQGLLGAQIAPSGGGAAQVGAAAAARLTFTVEPASDLEALWLELKTFLGDVPPAVWVAAALAALAAIAVAFRRRFAFRLERRS